MPLPGPAHQEHPELPLAFAVSAVFTPALSALVKNFPGLEARARRDSRRTARCQAGPAAEAGALLAGFDAPALVVTDPGSRSDSRLAGRSPPLLPRSLQAFRPFVLKPVVEAGGDFASLLGVGLPGAQATGLFAAWQGFPTTGSVSKLRMGK